MRRDRLRVENAGNFFYGYSGASMDRNYGGSDPRAKRYRDAIDPISSEFSSSAILFLQECESALTRTFFYPNPKT
jgi:hypothetical protein